MATCKNCGEKNLLDSDICGDKCIYCYGYNANEIDELIKKDERKQENKEER
jgi:hypothetical protein